MIRNLIFLFFILQSLQIAFASELEQNFISTFYTQYKSGRCGDNITSLLTRSEALGANIYNANILEITNDGFSVFGMVNAEFVRAVGDMPGERNWFHHVILENNGVIYDFDFGNTPQILPVREYFERMFLLEKTKEQGSMFYVGRERKLKEYKVVVRPAPETLQANRNRAVLPKIKTIGLGKYLKDF